MSQDGARVPDVACASAAFTARHGHQTPFPNVPESCVQVRSPSNPDAEILFKTELHLCVGAVEVWIVDDEGAWQASDSQGPHSSTRYGVQLRAQAQALSA